MVKLEWAEAQTVVALLLHFAFLLVGQLLRSSFTVVNFRKVIDSKGMEAASNLPLPDAFLQFLNDNGIDPFIYTAADFLPRYVRYL
ncbi:hypothetical protein HanOQP8_Chr09g0324501 [Helianthus annuus]|nr:hypothetical protein HanOQP8_Chr09g0324501 [Helianthus annuus]